MDKNTNSIVSVANHHNKSGTKKIRLDEALEKFPHSNTVCGSSIFGTLCKENGAKICYERNMEIFNRFANRGELTSY